MSKFTYIKRIRHPSHEEYLLANVGDQNDSHQQIFQVPTELWRKYVDAYNQALKLEIRMDTLCEEQKVPMT